MILKPSEMDSEDGGLFIKVYSLPLQPLLLMGEHVSSMLTWRTATCCLCAHSRKGSCQCSAIPAPRGAPSSHTKHELCHAFAVSDISRSSCDRCVYWRLTGRCPISRTSQLHFSQCQVCKAGSDSPPSLLSPLSLRRIGYQCGPHESSLRRSSRQLVVCQLRIISKQYPAFQKP
jgi:hypothetical protein